MDGPGHDSLQNIPSTLPVKFLHFRSKISMDQLNGLKICINQYSALKEAVIYRIAISKSWFLVATQCNNFWINDIPMLGHFNINFQNSTARDIVLHDGFIFENTL